MDDAVSTMANGYSCDIEVRQLEKNFVEITK